MPEDRDPHARRAEAQRLRSGTPDKATLPDSSNATQGPVAKEAPEPGTEPEWVEPLPESVNLGIYPLASKGVVDGDTVKVEGLDASLRLLGIDTEETFKKNKKDRTDAYADFTAYAKRKRSDSKYPAKYATPSGETASEWAKEWFSGVDEVRLEYDDLGRTRGVFGRYLVYIFAKKGEVWVNYNVECVRAGMSPYFPKYGYSKRFHDDFVAAQEEARFAQRGVWDESTDQHYPDYNERLEWWERRAQAIQHFESTHMGKEDVFQLGLHSEWTRMEKLEGQPVTVFGTIGQMRLEKGSPFLVMISHKKQKDFTVVAFERSEFDGLGLLESKGEYIYVRGTLGSFKGKLQFKATEVEKVWTE